MIIVNGFKVYNKKIDKNIPSSAVYVGRPTKWGNCFTHLNYGLAKFKTKTAQEAVDGYANWIANQPELLAALKELKGKDLVCWCVPNPCHASVLVELANK